MMRGFLFVNANNEVEEQKFELLNTHPHNPNNFTQGYEFFQDKLYESTGNPRQTNATIVAINQFKYRCFNKRGKAT